jgi:Spy/CpxP family protein refolding chaperone
MNALIRRAGLLLLVFAAVAAQSTAQDNPPQGQGRALERVEQFKKIRLMEVLNLDEQSSIKFFARYNKYQESLRELRKKQVQALGRMQELRKSKAADSEYDKMVDELLSLERQINEAKSKYVEELKGTLTSKQLAEYLVFEARFQQNLRDLVRNLPRNRQEPPTQ